MMKAKRLSKDREHVRTVGIGINLGEDGGETLVETYHKFDRV